MSQYIIIRQIKVQNANAIAGFTWGFPAITHFLGFVHALTRKMASNYQFNDISLAGCAVISHEYHHHVFGKYEKRFLQNKSQPYLYGTDAAKKSQTPPIIEEGKMNMTVSLVIPYSGTIGNRQDNFKKWLEKQCYLQRLAGGTILEIGDISLQTFEKDSEVRAVMYRMLPGFVLMDRSNYLKEHYENLQKKNPNVELLDAWLDFSALKQKARPKCELITKHLHALVKNNPQKNHYLQIFSEWQDHLENPYEEGEIPSSVQSYFDQMEESKENKKLLEQWKNYCSPNEKTESDWEYIPKPKSGYLVPIMTGYKAISKVYKNEEVANTRDNETDVCFVESVHSVGEWLSAHRIKTIKQLKESIWDYAYEENWYLCKQGVERLDNKKQNDLIENDDNIYS